MSELLDILNWGVAEAARILVPGLINPGLSNKD